MVLKSSCSRFRGMFWWPENKTPFCGSSYALLTLVVGFVALRWGSLHTAEWDLALGSLCLPCLDLASHLFVLLSLFLLGLKVWRLGRQCDNLEGILAQLGIVLTDRRSGSFVNDVVCSVCGSKIPSWKACQSGKIRGNLQPIVDGISSCELGSRHHFGGKIAKKLLPEFEEMSEDEHKGEEEVDDIAGNDVMALKKKITEERKLRNMAFIELEKERNAASSAAQEAMMKIVLLQNEKASIEREARLYREIAEQKQYYHEGVIESLQWAISARGEMINRTEDKANS